MEFVREGLATMGFCPPIAVDSGNGEYLLYKIDVPAEDNGLIKRCLQSLTSVNDDYVDIDVSVSNAGRIVRVAGTINCKGTAISPTTGGRRYFFFHRRLRQRQAKR